MSAVVESRPRRTRALQARRDDPAGVVVRAEGLVKLYAAGAAQVTALNGVDLHIARATFVAIMGPSGSGKSTLLHLLAALDSPTSGTLLVDDVDVAAMSERERARFRRNQAGFVFQSFNLVPVLTALENVALPAVLAGDSRRVRERRAAELIDLVELGHRRDVLARDLSGGQQQRVALARALMRDPALIFADEPTGSLDTRTGAELLGSLCDLTGAGGKTLVMVTHDPGAAAHAERIAYLRDGALVGELHSGPFVDRSDAELQRRTRRVLAWLYDLDS